MAEREGSIMKNGITEVVFILDRSGSMGGLESDTIGGYNAMLEKQKKEEGEAIISTVLFDDQTEVLHDRIPIAEMNLITEKEYYVRGCTALLDAVGGAVRHIKRVQKHTPPYKRPEKTIFIITTDGLENASRDYTYDKVKKLVEKQKEKHGWEFLFLGANMDAIKVAGRFGVDRKRAATYCSDGAGTQLNYDVMSHIVSCARASSTATEMSLLLDSDEVLAPIHADFKKRRMDGTLA